MISRFPVYQVPSSLCKKKLKSKETLIFFSQSQGGHLLSVVDTTLKALTSDHIQILAVINDQNILVDKVCHCSISHWVKIAIQTASFTLGGG